MNCEEDRESMLRKRELPVTTLSSNEGNKGVIKRPWNPTNGNQSSSTCAEKVRLRADCVRNKHNDLRKNSSKDSEESLSGLVFSL